MSRHICNALTALALSGVVVLGGAHAASAAPGTDVSELTSQPPQYAGVPTPLKPVDRTVQPSGEGVWP